MVLGVGLSAHAIVSWKEWFILVAEAFKCLKLRANVCLSVLIMTDIERYNADWVASDEVLIVLLVIETESEDAVKLLENPRRILDFHAFPVAVEGKDNLTVRARLELIASLIPLANLAMIVYLTVYGKHKLTVWREERLLTRLRIDDAESLMCKDRRTSNVDSAPVWSAMTDLLRHLQCFLTEFRRLFLNVQNTCYSTHNILVFTG